MNFYYIFVILFLFTYFINFLLLKNNLFLDSKKNSIHKNFVQNREKVSYAGGLIVLSGCVLFWNEGSILFKTFLILIFILGLLSDRGLLESPIKRFFLQSIVIFIFLYIFDIRISPYRLLFLDFLLEEKIMNLIFTTFCILIVVNGSNFMDGLNTLTIGYFLLILFSLLYIFFNNEIIFPNYDLITITIISAIVVFLYNIIGKIYLGDNGAYLIAFIVSFVLIEFSFKNYVVSPFYIANLLWYPAFENFFSIIRKVIQKKSPMSPDNLHLHQLLFSYFKKKRNLSKNFVNTFTGLVINFFNLIIFVFATIYYYNTKIQILTILVSIFIYCLFYFILNKESVRVRKKKF